MNYFTALLLAAGLPVTAALPAASIAPPASISSAVSNVPQTMPASSSMASIATVSSAYQTMAAQSQSALSTGASQAFSQSASAPVVTASNSGQGTQMIALINQARGQAGLAPYSVNAQLMNLAQERAQALANGPFTSDMAPYGWPVQMEQAAGLDAQGMGAENIAEAGSVSQAFALLMASPPHRSNILNPDETQIGVGVVPWGSGVAISELFMGHNL